MTTTHSDLKIALEQQRESLKNELEELNTRRDHSGMGYSTHQADDASEAFEQAADLAIRQNAERMLYQVERALQRMAAGTYGKCRNCDREINPDRLHAIPYTRYCIDCATKYPE